MSEPTTSGRIAVRNLSGISLVSAAILGVTCGAIYLLMTRVLGPLLSESSASIEIGGMWAVVATIFVYRARVDEGVKNAWTRLTATVLSLVICLAYLLFFPVTAVGIAVVIAAGAVTATLLGRPEDAALTGITSMVVLVVADLARPDPQWIQPVLRLIDTVLGMGGGLLAALVLIWITKRLNSCHDHN